MTWYSSPEAGLATKGLMEFASGFMSYRADKAASKAQRAWQAYSNTMVEIGNAVNQNAITTNEILANQAFADQDIQIQKGGLMAQAKAEVAAASAGVKGRSVNQAMFDVQRNAADREYQRQVSLKNATLAFDQQRLQSSMSAKLQKDYSYIPKPSPVSYFLNAGQNTLDYAQKLGFMK